MRNPMRCDELEEESDRWAKSFDDDQICQLASSFRGGDSDKCTMFKPRVLEFLSLTFFIEFEAHPERWVIKVPDPVHIPNPMIDELVEIEVATMRLVSTSTTIPVPAVRGYAFSDTSAIGVPFNIMEYVEGRTLKELGFNHKTKEESEKWGHLLFGETHTAAVQKLHRQLADVYVQLRHLEFHRVGALGFPLRAEALTCNPYDICVRHRPLTADMVLDELDGLEPGTMFPPGKTFPTARDYVKGLLWSADNRLEKHEDLEMDRKEPASILYAAHHFKRFVRDEWLNRSANEGPFVLMHGKLATETSPLLFDQDLNLVAVVGWEWSRVVPVQLMVPPDWLSGPYTRGSVLSFRVGYKHHVHSLCKAIKTRERELGLWPVLSTEWVPHRTSWHAAVVRALESTDSSYIHHAYWELIFERQVPIFPQGGLSDSEFEQKWKSRDNEEQAPRVRAFIEASEERRNFLKKKVQEQLRLFEAEKEYYKFPRARRIAKCGMLKTLGLLDDEKQ